MKTIRVGRGKNAIEVTGALADGMLGELRSALGPVLQEIEQEAAQILADAKKSWPVDSGTSRDSLYSTIQLDPDQSSIGAQILSTESYSRYIESSKVGRKKDAVRLRFPMRELLIVPAKTAQNRLKTVLPAILARHLGGRDG